MNTTFSNYLEKLRISRNISRNDFVSGILSERQYRRYLKGESTMPNDKVHLLVTKLGLDLADFYMSYLDDKESHLQVIKNLFNLIRTGKLAEANTLISTINYNELSTSYQKQFYTFCSYV